MSAIYGTNSDFELARTTVVSSLNGLVAAMAAVSPKIDVVYSSHLAEPALTFNSVSVSIPAIEMEFPAMKGSPAGSVLNTICQVELRVMIGNSNAYADEEKVARLCNSIVNWLEEHRGSIGSNFVVWKTARIETAVKFDDTDTIGGRVTFLLRSTNAYTAA